jgi:murein DD-endopeptidase MepM/ murein hydrolase activator NlpD
MKKNDEIKYIWLFTLILVSFCVLSAILISSSCLRQSDIPKDFTGVVPTEGKVVYHTVKEGETLWRIARQYGVSLDRLAGVNGIENPTKIYTGSVLIIPTEESNLKKIRAEISKEDYDKPLVWPIKGEISQYFSQDSQQVHDGIDIRAAEGTPIHAAGSGIVAYSGDQFRGYGNMIIIEHSEKLSTIYAHCSVLLVYEGDKVNSGHIIAKVGSTGNATGPHLHFEVRLDNSPVNPLDYLPDR